MGQSQVSSCTHPEEDVFLQQMRAYQWRADTKFNIFLPRVYFKSAIAQLKQQKFSEFLEQQSSKQYFQISKFKQQLEHVPNSTDDQVIVFQKYQCSLENLQGKMSFQQGLYALQALLAGYQQIKKVYQRVFIDASCCFITIQGSIRAWINPNVKSNRVWKEQQGDSIRHNIVHRTIKIVQEYTQIWKRSQDFFSNLLYNIAYGQLKNCSYSEVRRWINQYCYNNSVMMAKKINLNKKREQLARIKQSNVFQRYSLKPQLQREKDNNALFMSTQSSQFSRPFLMVRSLQKNIQHPSKVFQVRTSNLPLSPSRLMNSQSNGRLQSPSQGYATINISPGKKNFIVVNQATTQSSNQSSNLNYNMQVAKQIHKSCIQNIKKPQLPGSKIKEISSRQESQPIHSRKIAEQEIQISFKKPLIQNIAKKNQSFKDETYKKKSMQVSIMQNLVETNQVRKEVKYKTFADKQSERQSNTESACYSRPWITTKTITRLFSDNQDKFSLKNSIGESSDCYNGSMYSGVLTQMGRDVAKPVNQGRCKTLGLLRQQC